MRSRRRENDKCQKGATEDDWYRGRAVLETAGGKRIKTCQMWEENDTKADVRMRGGRGTCCTCKLIKQHYNGWVTKERDGGKRKRESWDVKGKNILMKVS